MRRILFLLIFGLTGVGILVGLGTWQVQRLQWKQSILAEIDRRIADAPIALPDAPDPARDMYLPVQVSGTFEPGELHVLVSVKQVGPGFRIIAPYRTRTGRRILVDRGFVKQDQKDGERALGPVDVIGNLHWPQETDSYTPAPDAKTATWFARDVPAMAAVLNTEPVLVVAKSRTDTAVSPIPVDTVGIPNDHLQYAITWFSLALIWAAMTAAFLWRTRAQPTG